MLVNTPMAAFRGTGANHQQNNSALRLKLAMKCDMPCKGACLCFSKCVHVSICSLLKHRASLWSWKRLSFGMSLLPEYQTGKRGSLRMSIMLCVSLQGLISMTIITNTPFPSIGGFSRFFTDARIPQNFVLWVCGPCIVGHVLFLF